MGRNSLVLDDDDLDDAFDAYRQECVDVMVDDDRISYPTRESAEADFDARPRDRNYRGFQAWLKREDYDHAD